MSKELRVVHLFSNYLPQTMNWAYHLISNLKQTHNIIAAPIIQSSEFSDPSFTFVKNPYQLEVESKIQLKKTGIELLRKIWIEALTRSIHSYPRVLKKELRKYHPDLLHAHFADIGCLHLSLKKRLNAPLVVSFYGADYEYLPIIKPKYRSLYQQLFKVADLLICEGGYGASVLKKMGCRKDKIRVVRLGVDPAKIQIHHRQKKSKELQLVQVATFTEKKGQLQTVQAFRAALKECPNMRLTFVGGIHSGKPEYRNAVVRYVESNQLKSKVTILEKIDFSKLHGFLETFQVMIHPSQYSKNRDCEGGAPIVLLDGQATGLPIISTKHCDIPSEVNNLNSGILVPERDVHELSKAIARFYYMKNEEYQIFSKNARQHVEEFYDIKENAKVLRNLYESVV